MQYTDNDIYGNRQGCARLIRISVTGIAILIAIGLFLVSCSSPRVITRTEYRDRYKTDTIQQIDSFYQYRYIREKGDTVYIHDSIDRWRTKERLVREFIHDSIDRPVEVIKPKTHYEKFIYGSGYALWGLIVIVIIIFVVKLLIRLHII